MSPIDRVTLIVELDATLLAAPDVHRLTRTKVSCRSTPGLSWSLTHLIT